MLNNTRSSACVPVVAGTHAPGRGEGVEGLRRWFGDIITAVSCCRGWKGQKTIPSCANVDDTHAPDRRTSTCLTATNNPRQINMLQPGTCYARPIYPEINTCHFYKVHFEVPGIV